jgi:hypothetical protein
MDEAHVKMPNIYKGSSNWQNSGLQNRRCGFESHPLCKNGTAAKGEHTGLYIPYRKVIAGSTPAGPTKMKNIIALVVLSVLLSACTLNTNGCTDYVRTNHYERCKCPTPKVSEALRGVPMRNIEISSAGHDSVIITHFWRE